MIFLSLLFTGCYSQQHRVTVINQSAILIDSLHIGVTSADTYSATYKNIRPHDTLVFNVPGHKPASNNHNVTAFITICFPGAGPVYSYYYDDLAGYLTGDLVVYIDQNRKVVWKSGR